MYDLVAAVIYAAELLKRKRILHSIANNTSIQVMTNKPNTVAVNLPPHWAFLHPKNHYYIDIRVTFVLHRGSLLAVYAFGSSCTTTCLPLT